MSGSLSDAAAAARSGPRFSVQDCCDLDVRIRHNSTEFYDLASFGDTQLREICGKLNVIANWYSTQIVIGPMKPPLTRYLHLSKIEKKAVELLTLLGITPESNPHDVSMQHLIADGVFAKPRIEFEQYVEGVQKIALHAREAADTLMESGVEAQQRSPDLIRYRLYDDLGAVYKDQWGRGDVPVSLNAGKGGPAIRFFEFTLDRILGEPVKAQAIKDAVETIKKGGVDLSNVYSSFTPDGGRRI